MSWPRQEPMPGQQGNWPITYPDRYLYQQRDWSVPPMLCSIFDVGLLTCLFLSLWLTSWVLCDLSGIHAGLVLSHGSSSISAQWYRSNIALSACTLSLFDSLGGAVGRPVTSPGAVYSRCLIASLTLSNLSLLPHRHDKAQRDVSRGATRLFENSLQWHLSGT